MDCQDIEFEHKGSKFVAYWCESEDKTRLFPKVRSLMRVNPRMLKEAHQKGVRLLEKKR